MKNKDILEKLENYMTLNRKKDNEVIEEIVSNNSSVTNKDFTYGSTPYDTAKSLISTIKKKPERFVVFGASVGWMCFYWNEMFPNIETVGVDLHTGRVDFGNKLIKEHGLSNIKLVTDNVFNFKLEDTDLLWQSNLCFENSVAEKLTNSIIDNYPEIAIISYKPIFYARKYVKRHYFPVSWMEKQPFFTYEKI